MGVKLSKRNGRSANDIMTKSEETIHAHAEVAENTNAVAVNDFFSETCAGESGVSILPSNLASVGVAGVSSVRR